MAATKKKRKAFNNPARGFATVSTPSKRVDESPPPEVNDDGETTPSRDDKPVKAEREDQQRGISEHGASTSDLQHMTPDELERHLEEAGLQTLLDLHGRRSKKDAGRQVARLETERRSLRQSGMVLETDGWLKQVLVEEILDLAPSPSPSSSSPSPSFPGLNLKSVQTVVEQPPLNETDLCIKLWIVQQTLESLRFRNIQGALRHLTNMSSMIPNTTPNSPIWGLDEAISWLALYSDPQDLPAYQGSSSNNAASLFESPASASTSGENIVENIGENIDGSDLRRTRQSSYLPCLDSSDPDACLSTSMGNAQNETSSSSIATAVSDDSDDNDPEMLIDRYLSAKYDLLKGSLSRSGGIHQEELLVDRGAYRLQRRIQKIEHDILFDREEAMARWDQVKKDLEVEHARANTSAMRRSRAKNTRTPTDDGAADCERESCKPTAPHDDDDDMADDLLGSLFALNGDDDQENHAVPLVPISLKPPVPISLRDFGPLGAGAHPRKVLEDFCRARDPTAKVIVRKISTTQGQFRHSARIVWSKNQDVASSTSYLPAQVSFEFQPHSTAASMVSIATPSVQQSEGYVCTLMLFILSQATKDDKVYLRLQTVWRDVWKELLAGKQGEVDRADREVIKQIQAMIAEERQKQTAESNEQPEQKHPVPNIGTKSKPVEDKRNGYTSGYLKSLWEEKTCTVGYQKLLMVRQQLPIWEHRHQIINTISAHQVTILCAETGAGKSTQVPSFILESNLNAGHDCRILITQPRRISAISLARRVSEELGEQKSEIGSPKSLVGFAIRLESKVSSATRITYVTTGVLLRMLETSKNLEDLDYLVLDEVHERTMDLDLLFIALRRLVQRRQSIKIVLMSATIDARKFSEYFGNAPILNIPGRTFPVEVKYLEDALELTTTGDNATSGPHVVETYEVETGAGNESERIKSLTLGLERYSLRTRKILAGYDEYKIDYTLIADLVTAISSDDEHGSRSILIFMPGIAEIRRLQQTIMSVPTFTTGWVIHLLHSSFSTDDLEKAFEQPPAQHRKIVIATNIAETGITIPDVTAVIDSSREKVMRYDERRQLSKLTEAFISRSSARQRRGRAARVQKGLCFHLITRYRHDNLLPEHHVPEMLRLSLQDPILRIKIWKLGDIEQTLSEALEPPTSRNVTRAIQLLKDVKALTNTESLTWLGRQLAKLPLDLWLGKLVLHGLTFGCLDATVTIAAMLSAKSPFLDSGRSDNRAASIKLAFNKGNSDLLLVYNAYCAWRRACFAGDVHEFCRRNLLSPHVLSQIEDQKVQLLVTMSDAGTLLLDESEKGWLRRSRLGGGREMFMIPQRYSMYSNNEYAVNSVIAMALYPQLLLREGQGWRNVAKNQQVNISQRSVNYGGLPAAVTWLSFYQSMQTKSKNPTVFETSAVPEAAMVILLGEADFKMYAGVITLEGGKIRFSIRDWKTMIALKVLRTKIEEALLRSYRTAGLTLSPDDVKWLNIWQQMVASRKAQEG